MPPEPRPRPQPAACRRTEAPGGIAHRFPPPLPAQARAASERLLLRATRLWILDRCAGRPPRARVEALVGPAAAPLGTLLESLSGALPEPFRAFPCCALAVSPDEALLLELVAAAGAGAPARAERLLAELLPAPVRARLFALAGRVALLLPADRG